MGEATKIDENTMHVSKQGGDTYEVMFFQNERLVVLPGNLFHDDEIVSALREHSHVDKVVKHSLATSERV